jgi:hypothetical protein
MLIPKGVSGGQSVRFGMLYGRRLSTKWGFEVGYFHDFSDGNPSYEGLPSEYSRSTGMSLQLFMYLGPTKKKKK